MSKLTVTEKEHWKQRVERRIQRAIDALSQQHPSFLGEVEEEARQAALEGLGIAQLQASFDVLDEQVKTLTQKRDEVELQIFSKVTNVPVERVGRYSHKADANQVISRHQKVLEEELLAKTTVGQQFLALRREKEELLDTIWLATSSNQIKELWGHVASFLGETATELQADILQPTQN